MRKLSKLMTAVFAVVLAAGMLFGALASADFAYADDGNAKGYTYTVKIYSGKEGYFDGDESKHVKTIEGLKFKEEYKIDINDIGLTLLDPDKYYARGVKVAGHDNDEISRRIYQSGSFRTAQDESYSVAYGMKGGMVQYTVRYVDESGSELLDSETFYGMAGDKPVVSYKYIEGYLPHAYNLGKTLSEDESRNVFTFIYYSTKADETSDDGGNNNGAADASGGNGTDGTNGGNGANGAGAANAGGNGTDNGDGREPAEYVDLDDGETPLAEGDDNSSLIDDDNTPKVGIFGDSVLLISAIAAILIVLLLFFLMRRRRQE